MKKPFRYFGNETPKEFRQSAFREILSAFYFSETAFYDNGMPSRYAERGIRYLEYAIGKCVCGQKFTNT